MRLVFVTGNAGKLAEARQLLAGLADIDQDAGGYPEIQADTLAEVAQAGLDAVATRRDPPFFLEDAGLFVDGLGGFPGVYSAYAYHTLGPAGVLQLLQARPDVPRTARFEAVVAYRDAAGTDHLFTGTCSGTIAPEARGTGGFGFDPVFVPDGGDGRTFAEMDPDEKGHLSHRGAAMRAFADHLRSDPGPGPHENPS